MNLMRVFWMSILSFPLTIGAQEEEKEEAVDSSVMYSEDFDGLETGDVPSDYFVIEGDWSIAELDGGKSLKLAEAPLVESSVQLGKSLKTGGTIRARIKADRKRRSFPRFGVGLHGLSGFKLRLVPVQGKIELMKGGIEESVQATDFEWRGGEWFFLELTVKEAGDAWTVSGRAWAEVDARPKQAQIEYIATDVRLSGKGSVTGTAYAGLPIFYDDIEVRMIGDPEAAEEKE